MVFPKTEFVGRLAKAIFASAGLICALVLLTACPKKAPSINEGRWIHLDPKTQRYRIDAEQVERGLLLDELTRISHAEVRPQPQREEKLSLHARDLELDELVARLLPPDTRFVLRAGEREIATAIVSRDKRKEGPPVEVAPGLVAKSKEPPALIRTGTLKPEANLPMIERSVSGPGLKVSVAELTKVAEPREPKKPLLKATKEETVRVTLEFTQGAPPRVISARMIEGRAPVERFVSGSYLFAIVGADGRVAHYGTFQDPLIEHSYTPEGPHAEGRASSGMVSIMVARESLTSGRLQIFDLTGVPPPRELNPDIVRETLMRRAKPVAAIETQEILRALDQGKR